ALTTSQPLTKSAARRARKWANLERRIRDEIWAEGEGKESLEDDQEHKQDSTKDSTKDSNQEPEQDSNKDKMETT
ncbi:MAG: hypothetical protein Q9215_008205, partial [Flavoplaca cf. flavocitrina]